MKKNRKFTTEANDCASVNGFLHIVVWFHENNKISHTVVNDFERLCVDNRVLEISLLLDKDETDEIFYLPWKKSIPLSTMACFYGKLEIVKILHEKNRKFTIEAIDCASGNPFPDIVEFLCKNRNEGFTEIAIFYAKRNGHTRIVEILNENTRCKKGFLEIVVYLVRGCIKNSRFKKFFFF